MIKRLTTWLVACALPFSLTAAQKDDLLVKKLTRSSTEFGMSLYTVLNTSYASNLVFSPYSIFSTLSMVYMGARQDTSTEIANTLHLTLNRGQLPQAAGSLAQLLTIESADSYILDTANGMWLDRDTFVLADFQHAIEKGYHAKVQSLDFSKTEEATSIINEWTSNQTRQEIPELLQPGDIDGSTRLVLTNAVYFKGSWVKPFDPKKTQEDSFFLDEASSVPVKMMRQAGSFSYFENETLQVLALPFVKKEEKSEIVCLFMLPKKDVPLLELEGQVSAASFQDWVGKLERKNITMKIPKFCLDNRFDLNQALKDLGMTGSFQSQADFSGIDGMRDLYLSKVVHETYFSLDEAGVTAAAATGASINVTATPPGTPPISFTCDHPFLFALVDLNTKLPLFWGKIQDPSMAQCE